MFMSMKHHRFFDRETTSEWFKPSSEFYESVDEHLICHKIAGSHYPTPEWGLVKAGTITCAMRDLTKEIEDGGHSLQRSAKARASRYMTAMMQRHQLQGVTPPRRTRCFRNSQPDRSWKVTWDGNDQHGRINKKRTGSPKANIMRPLRKPGTGKTTVPVCWRALLMVSSGRNLLRGSNVRSDLFEYWSEQLNDPGPAWKARGASLYWWSLYW